MSYFSFSILSTSCTRQATTVISYSTSGHHYVYILQLSLSNTEPSLQDANFLPSTYSNLQSPFDASISKYHTFQYGQISVTN